MKWCPKCGKALADDAAFCAACGSSVNSAPQQPVNNYQQPVNNYQQPVQQTPYVEDVPSTGMNVLCFFIPIIGLIFYLVEKDKTPIKAKAMGKWALIGFCVNMGLSVLFSVLAALLPLLIYGLY